MLVFVQPLENLSFGLTFRSASSFKFEGSANFETPDEFQSRASNGPVSTSLTMPTRWAIGVQWAPLRTLELAAEVEYNQWSSVDVLLIDFQDPGTEDVEKVRDWSDTTAFRFGASYTLNNSLALRGGCSGIQARSRERALVLTHRTRHGLGLVWVWA